MSLPKNCLYTNKIQSSYARNYMSVIQPQNGDAILGDTIIFNIPTGNNLVLSGADTVMKFDLTIKAAAAGNAINTIYYNKAGGFGCFQRMRIFHGGTLLSDIDNYGNLLDILICFQQSTDILGAKYNILASTNVTGGASANTVALAGIKAIRNDIKPAQTVANRLEKLNIRKEGEELLNRVRESGQDNSFV